MERNVQKNGLVNLVAAAVIFIAAFAVTVYVNSLAGQAASVFLGLGALVAFASWFQMRLEENERLEKLEVDGTRPHPGRIGVVRGEGLGGFPGAPRAGAVREIFRAGLRRAAVRP